MGLDMYVFKTKAITEEDALQWQGMREDDIDKRRYSVLHMDDLDGDIKKCGHVVPCLVNTFNEQRMRQEKNVPPEYVKAGSIYSGGETGSVSFFYRSEDATEKTEVELSSSEYDSFVEYVEEPVLICGEFREFFYWRKRWDIQENVIAKALDVQIENCGFYILTDKAIDAIGDADQGFAQSVMNNLEEDDILVYHPWW